MKRYLREIFKSDLFKMTGILVLVFSLWFVGYSCLLYKCSQTEKCLYYGNTDYCFASVYVGSGSTKDSYDGVIKVEDYNKWYNGEDGTMFVYSAIREGYGYRVNISTITSIKNLGCKPDSLHLSFWR